ncbi:MAG TPA: adenylyltransferase/cytidyltransferase family protein [Patescibacteria group bacterium]|nr:adenylyltransferase/cytidyltransferase family protein [Patescibacteria group bacterium]
MGTILSISKLKKLPQLKFPNQTLVLVGGCFDILHAGHIEFLKKAKEKGDILLVLLESDEKIRKIKGNGRPINSQEDRATILANLSTVDYVYPLEYMEDDESYETLVKHIQPDIIAITEADRVFDWEERLSEIGIIKIVRVMKRNVDFSTTKLAQKIKI